MLINMVFKLSNLNRKMKMEIKNKFGELGLNSNNVVVIGSGILSALNLRESKDIDVVTTEKKYKELSDDNRFHKEQNHKREILADDLFEIGTSWTVVGKNWKFEDLLNNSTIIDSVRYNSVEFLLNAKRRWIADGEGRQKDIDDVKLIEQFSERFLFLYWEMRTPEMIG